MLDKNLQTLRTKDIPGENVSTVVSYLKGALMILNNCDKLRTDTIGLLEDTICLAECNESIEFMSIVYIKHKIKNDCD